jgi:putative membrane protein
MELLGGSHRAHWSYILTGAIKGLYKWFFFILFIVGSALRNSSGVEDSGGFSTNNLYLVIAILSILALVLLTGFLQYFYLRWEVTDTDIRLRRGVLEKTDSRVPFERIHSVNVKANIIERIFGVVSFSLDTAGGQADADLTIPSIRKPLAEELRRHIYEKKGLSEGDDAPAFWDVPRSAQGDGQAPPAGGARGWETVVPRPAPAGRDAFSQSYRIRPSELFLHGLSNGNGVLYTFIGISFLSQFLDIPVIEGLVSDVTDSAIRNLASLSVFFVVLIALVILAIAWAVSVVASVFKFFGFAVQRRGNRIEIERGLLTRRTTGCAVDRIQKMHIRRPALRRLIGYAEIRVEMAATVGKEPDTTEGLGVSIHPFVRYREIDGFLREILPEFAGAPNPESGLPPVSLLRTYLWYFIWSAVLIAATFIPVWFLLRDIAPAFPREGVFALALILFLAFICVTAYRSWRGRGLTMNDDFLVMKRGAYTFTTVTVPRRKIQLARSQQNFFQKKVRVAHVDVNSAANGGAGSVERIRDVSEEQAFTVLEWVRPRGVRGPARS